LTFKAAVLQDCRIFRIEHDNHFAMGLGSILGKKSWSAAGDQARQEGKRNKDTPSISELHKTVFHAATPKVRVETRRRAPSVKIRWRVTGRQDY
jgi:hypothetical protein